MINNLKIGEVYVRLQFKKDKKIIDIIKREKEKYVNLHKEEPVDGKATSSKIIQTANKITINS